MSTQQKGRRDVFANEEEKKDMEKKEAEKEEIIAKNDTDLMKSEFHTSNIVNVGKDLECAFSKGSTSKDNVHENQEYEKGKVKEEIERNRGNQTIKEIKVPTVQKSEQAIEKNKPWNNSSKREHNEKEQINEEMKNDYLENSINKIEMNYNKYYLDNTINKEDIYEKNRNSDGIQLFDDNNKEVKQTTTNNNIPINNDITITTDYNDKHKDAFDENDWTYDKVNNSNGETKNRETYESKNENEKRRELIAEHNTNESNNNDMDNENNDINNDIDNDENEDNDDDDDDDDDGDGDECYSPNCESELDNKSKRKINEIKQNEQNKKIKNDADSNNTSCNSNNELLKPNDGTLNDSLNVTFREESKMESNQNSDIDKLENGEYQENVFVEEILEKYPRIFATRLPFEVTEKDLEKHFSKYGKIVDIYLSKNIKNNRNNGFGFISYETKEAMERALQEKLHIIGGKEIVVDIASSRNQKKIFYLPSDHNLVNNPNVKNTPRNKNYRNRGWNVDKSHNYNNTRFDQHKREFKLYPGMNPHHTFPPNMNYFNRSKITNCKAMDEHSFKKMYPPQKYPYLGYYYPNCSNYVEYPAFSNFKNHYGFMGSNQVYMQNNLSNPNYVQHSYDLRSRNYSKDNHKQHNPQIFYKSNNSNSPAFMHKLPGGDEWNKRGYKLFVTKLNSATTVETVRNYFENFGEVIDVYFPNDPETNRPRGIAFVTFLDSECTKQILSKKDMKHIIDGKEVVVDLADPDAKHKKKFRGM